MKGNIVGKLTASSFGAPIWPFFSTHLDTCSAALLVDKLKNTGTSIFLVVQGGSIICKKGRTTPKIGTPSKRATIWTKVD